MWRYSQLRERLLRVQGELEVLYWKNMRKMTSIQVERIINLLS